MWPSATPWGVPEGWQRASVPPDHLQGPKCVCAREGAEQALCPQAVSMPPPVCDKPPLWLPLKEPKLQLPQQQMGAQPWGPEGALGMEGTSSSALGTQGQAQGHRATAVPGVPGPAEESEGWCPRTGTTGNVSLNGSGADGFEGDKPHRMTESQNSQGSWSAALAWLAHAGTEGTAVVLSAPCSAQQIWS